LVLDGSPLDLRFINSINPNDVSDVTILKSAASTAIYGPDGVNGAIIITSRKGRNNLYQQTNLKAQDDVEYVTIFNNALPSERVALYNEMKETYGDNAGFYLDMAELFFKHGNQQTAYEALMNAAELSNGDVDGQRAVAYVLEDHGNFSEAIKIYKSLQTNSTNDASIKRELAWAYYQNKNWQLAVNTMYAAIVSKIDNNDGNYAQARASMLSEMNAMISTSKEKIDVSNIPASIIRPLPADIRVSIESNRSAAAYLRMTGPNMPNYYSNYYYWNNMVPEYQLRNATKGKYRIYTYPNFYKSNVPSIMRVRKFKNFGRANQEMTVENIMMDNQNGDVEISEIKW